MKYKMRHRVCASLIALSMLVSQQGLIAFATNSLDNPNTQMGTKYHLDLSDFSEQELSEFMYESTVSPMVRITEGEVYSLRVDGESGLLEQRTSLIPADVVYSMNDAEVRGSYWLDSIGYQGLTYAELSQQIREWVTYCNTNIGDLHRKNTTLTVDGVNSANLSDLYCLLKKTAYKVENRMQEKDEATCTLSTSELSSLRSILLKLQSDSFWTELIALLKEEGADYGVTEADLAAFKSKLQTNNLLDNNLNYVRTASSGMQQVENRKVLKKVYDSESEFLKAWDEKNFYSAQRMTAYSDYFTGFNTTGSNYTEFYDTKFDKLFAAKIGDEGCKLLQKIPDYSVTYTSDVSTLANEWNTVYSAFVKKVNSEVALVKQKYVWAIIACCDVSSFESMLSGSSTANEIIGYLGQNFATLQSKQKGAVTTVIDTISQNEVTPWLYLSTGLDLSSVYTDNIRGGSNALSKFNPVYGDRTLSETDLSQLGELGYTSKTGVFKEESVIARIVMYNPKYGQSVIAEYNMTPAQLNTIDWYVRIHNYISSELNKCEVKSGSFAALPISQSMSQTLYTNALMAQLGFTKDCKFVVEISHNYVADVERTFDTAESISESLDDTVLLAPIPEYSLSEYYESITELPTVDDYNKAHGSSKNIGTLTSSLNSITNNTNTPVNSPLAIKVQPSWQSRLMGITYEKQYASGWKLAPEGYRTYKANASAGVPVLAHFARYDTQSGLGTSGWSLTKNPASYGLAADVDAYYTVVAEASGSLNAGTPYYRTVERVTKPITQFTNDNVKVSKDLTGNTTTTGGLQAYFNNTAAPLLSWDFDSKYGITNLKTGDNTYDIDYYMWLCKTSADDGIYVADWIPNNTLPQSFKSYIDPTTTQTQGSNGVLKSTAANPNSATGEVRSKADYLTMGNAETTTQFSDYALSKWIEATPYVWCDEYNTFVSQADLADHMTIYYNVRHHGVRYTSKPHTYTETYTTTETAPSWQADMQVFDLLSINTDTIAVDVPTLAAEPVSGSGWGDFDVSSCTTGWDHVTNGPEIPEGTDVGNNFKTNVDHRNEALDWENGSGGGYDMQAIKNSNKYGGDDTVLINSADFDNPRDLTLSNSAQWLADNYDLSGMKPGDSIKVVVYVKDPKTGREIGLPQDLTIEPWMLKSTPDPEPEQPDPLPEIPGKKVVEDSHEETRTAPCNCNPHTTADHSYTVKVIDGYHYEPATKTVTHTKTVTYYTPEPEPYEYFTLESKSTHVHEGGHTDVLYLFKYNADSGYGSFSYSTDVTYNYKHGHIGSASNPISEGATPVERIPIYDSATKYEPTPFASDPDSMRAQSKIKPEIEALDVDPNASSKCEGTSNTLKEGLIQNVTVVNMFKPEANYYASPAEALKGRTIVGDEVRHDDLTSLFGVSGTPDTWLTIDLSNVRGVVRRSSGDFYTIAGLSPNSLLGIQNGDEAIGKLGDYTATVTTPKYTYTVKELISRITTDSDAYREKVIPDYKVTDYGNPNAMGVDATETKIEKGTWQSDYRTGTNDWNIVPEVLMTYKDGITNPDGTLLPNEARGAIGHVYVAGYNEYTLEFPMYNTIDVEYDGTISSSASATATGKNASALSNSYGNYPVVYTGADVATTFEDADNKVKFTSWVLDFNNASTTEGNMAIKAAKAWNANYSENAALAAANQWLNLFKEDKNNSNSMFKANLTCTTTFTVATTDRKANTDYDKAVPGSTLGTGVDNKPISSTVEVFFGKEGETAYTTMDAAYRVKIRNGRLASVFIGNQEYAIFDGQSTPNGYATSQAMLAAAKSASAVNNDLGVLYNQHYEVFEALYNMELCEFAAQTFAHDCGTEQWNKYQNLAPTRLYHDNKGNTITKEIWSADAKFRRNDSVNWYGEDTTILTIKKYSLTTALPATMNVASKVPASYGYKSPTNKADLFKSKALYAWAEFGITFVNAPASTVGTVNTGTFDLAGNELTKVAYNHRDPEIQYIIADGNVNDMY